jgi:hypothetical protein
VTTPHAAADVRPPSSEGVPGVGAGGPEVPQARIGWLRAIGSGLAILIVGLGLTLFGTDRLLTSLTGMERDTRVLVATGVFILIVVVAAWLLRRLQARGLI